MADENMNEGGGTTTGAQDKFETSKTQAKSAAEHLKSATTAIAEDYREKATQAWDDAKVRMRTLRGDGEDYVRENPAKVVFVALGIGLVLGLIVRGR